MKATDENWMRRALKWSATGRGWTSPRPSVGCVLVRDGQVIGGGHTQPGDGQPHAEVMALRAAHQAFPDKGAHGATAYVTLEPCSHWGTTPPCCEALAKEGVVRVVAGVSDPNPLVSGRGFRWLREQGIEVVTGVLQAECRRAQDDFLKSIVSGTPFVTLKSAVSLDGRIALPDGSSRWITGQEARQRAHLMRHEADAVVVGIGTVLADDPHLSVRLDTPAKQPIRVVLDSRARLPLDAKIWKEAPELVVAVSKDASDASTRALIRQGATVLKLPEHQGKLRWDSLLEELYQRKLISVLIEGGARVAGSALAAGIVDKVVWFVAPVLLGEGKAATKGFNVVNLKSAPRLEDVWTEKIGDDVLVAGYLRKAPADS